MPRLAHLWRHTRESWEVPRDLLLGRYPAFVRGGPLRRGEVPVFCFHSLEPHDFGRKVEHLARNGYTSLSADEYFAFLQGRCAPPERAVVLTFDDGRSSVRSVGLPLMRRHGLRGIVFIVPGRIESRPGPLPPTLDDLDAGAGPAALVEREHGPQAFLSWEEIADLRRSGLFEFASHSLSHARVHVSPHLAGFMHPGLRQGYGPLDVPWIRAAGRDLFGPEVPLGTPLLRSQPRLSDALRFFEDPAPRAHCQELVAHEGGERFFERPGWEARLRQALRGRPWTGRFETPEEREAAIAHELREARRLIEERLGAPAPDLCYPWHVAGASARRLARECGYRSAYCGKVTGVPLTPAGGDPLAIARVGEDYLELLPGRGRVTLAAVLKRKLVRRGRAAAS